MLDERDLALWTALPFQKCPGVLAFLWLGQPNDFLVLYLMKWNN